MIYSRMAHTSFDIVDAMTRALHEIPLPLPKRKFPPAPQIDNWIAAQIINATNGFTLTWNAFPGGTTNDFIEVSVQGEVSKMVFSTPRLGTPGALNGGATAARVP